MTKIKRILNRDKIVITIVIVLCVGTMIVYGQSYSSICTIDVNKPGALVAPICGGQQIEEFNHQFEGGLYAQLINNPSFNEVINPIAAWFLVKSGSSGGKVYSQTPTETSMLNSYQNHCIKLEVTSVASGNVGLANGGYCGIKLENNTKYRISFWAKSGLNFKGIIRAKLESNDGTIYAQSSYFKPTTDWQHFSCELTTKGVSTVTGTNRFVIYASTTGDVYLDVITVMPPTWKNRPNGLRLDLAEKLDALKFNYLQFPGGCTAESYKMSECWNWKNSIGPLEQRAGSTRDRWGYKNDLYFGLDEYLQLCEDLGAEAVYTCSSGVSEPHRPNGPWYGVCPFDELQLIIDDILDLIQYCNGSISTPWGAKRAANGHPTPYNLKYIEIGNEGVFDYNRDGIIYSDRYRLIYNAIKSICPDLKIMYNGNLGPGPSRTYGNFVDYTDEHFYLKDLSVFYNKYDSIDPSWRKMCVAEYASSINGNGGNIIGNFGDALGDAVFMLGCEKNSERMWWTGYGNYAGLIGQSNFGPCMVWNDAVSCFTTPSYYMEKILFSDNRGTRILPFTQNSANCYWSTSIDNESGKNDVLLKVVNKSDTSEYVNITLNGVSKVDPLGHSSILTGALNAENSITNPNNVIPVAGTFIAGTTFKYLFPAYSITLLRIGIIK